MSRKRRRSKPPVPFPPPGDAGDKTAGVTKQRTAVAVGALHLSRAD